jgi:hypothetical protein
VRWGKILPTMKPKIKTIEQAFEFIQEVKVCLIFGSEKSGLPSLWEAVDLPERQEGEKGWGKKVMAIWAWKNELPAQFPDEIFYGKLPGGLAVLMFMEHLRDEHYPANHRSVSTCSALAQRAYQLIDLESQTTAEVRKSLSPTGRVSKSKVDTALVELQVTLNIVRSNAVGLKRDTWLPFKEQYHDFTDA